MKPSELVAAIDALAKIAHEEKRYPMVLGAPLPWELLSEYERVVTRRQVAVVLHAIARRPEFAEVHEMLLPNAVLATAPKKRPPALMCPKCRKLLTRTKRLQLVSLAQEPCAECRKDELPW